MDIAQFISKISSDPPFSYPHPDERTRAILVETSSVKLYKQELGFRVRNFMQNSGITAIIGRAGSGKTHFIYNLEHVTNTERRYKGLVVYLSLHGEDLEFQDLVGKIVENKNFQKIADEVKVDKNKHKGIGIIVQLVKELQGKFGKDTGIILAVDNLDEHFRQRETTAKEKNISPQNDIEKFLGLFRLLTGEGNIEKGLCVLFSLTEDGANKLGGFLKDPTLLRRFDLIYNPNDPGQRLELSGLSEDEAILLVSQYMSHWSNRNKVPLPDTGECKVGNFNIFPFTKEAILMFLSAGPYAGSICLGCKNALSRKYDAQSVEELIVNKRNAAFTISASANMFPNFSVLRPEISNLIGGPELELETKNWIDTVAKTKFSGSLQRANFKNAFQNYLEAIVKENKEEAVRMETGTTVIDAYTNEPYKLDLRINFAESRIGVLHVNTAMVSLTDGKPLVSALTNKNVTHGLFVYAGKKPGIDFMGQRKQGLDLQLANKLYDYTAGTDFNSVVTLVQIDEMEAWGIIMGNDITDANKKTKLFSWLEGRVQILKKLKDLSSSEHRTLSPSKPLRAGDILGRGGA